MSKAQPAYTMPSRKYLCTKLLPERLANLRDNIKKNLQAASSTYITLDLWSSRDMRSFMGVTCHFIVNLTLMSVLLTCQRFYGSHTGESIYRCYEQVVSEFEINKKIPAVVTESASNMVKAFTLPGYSVDVDEEEDEDHSDLQPTTVDVDDVAEFIEAGSMICNTTEDTPLFPERVPCFAHTLQLTVKDGLKEGGQLRSVISKILSFVSFIRKSHHASELLERCHKLQLANATRWNSQLKMIRSVIQIPDDIMDDIDYSNKPSAHEMKLLHDSCEILRPFEEATNLTQGQNVVTASEVIICVRSLREQLSQLETKFKSRLLTSLQNSLEGRLSKFESIEILQLATALDPRYKLD